MGIDDNISKRIDVLIKEYEQCANDLCLEEVLMDTALLQRLEKRMKEIAPIKTKYENYLALLKKYNETKSILSIKNNDFLELDRDIKIMIEELTKSVLMLDAETEKVTIEIIHPSNQSNKLSLDILSGYQNYCNKNQYEIAKSNQSENCYKLEVIGKNCFKQFVGENGYHNTDGCSVFVLVYLTISKSVASFDDKDIKIDVYRSNGAGGQNVNKVSTAIRMTHLPTNIVVTCQDERSQFQNRQRAYVNLREKVNKYFDNNYEKELQKSKKKYTNKSVVKKYDYNNMTITNVSTKQNISLQDFVDGNKL